MNRRAIILIAVSLLAGAGLLLAEDFWKVKKFGEWTTKEAEKMISNSPWARAVDISMGSPGGGGGGGRSGGRRGGGGGGGGGMPSAETSSMGGEMGGGGGGRGGGGMGGEMGGSVPTIRVTVRWHSALPVKQAVAKMRYGAEADSSAQVAKILARQETHYIVGLAGLPPQAMRGRPEQIKKTAVLRVKGKGDLQPDNVQGEQDKSGRVNLYLFFPRDKDGAPFIKQEDKDVEVQVKLGALEIKRKFPLKDMVYEGKLEI